jgi:hypothetical protein
MDGGEAIKATNDSAATVITTEAWKGCFIREDDLEKGVLTRTHDRRVVDEDPTKESDEFRFCSHVMKNILTEAELESIVRGQNLTVIEGEDGTPSRRERLVQTLIKGGKNVKAAMIGCLGQRQTEETKPLLLMLSVPTFPYPDPIYTRLGGLMRGNCVWRRTGYSRGYLLADLMDYRWYFPHADAAATYLRESHDRLSERHKLRKLDDASHVAQLTSKRPWLEDVAMYGAQLAPSVPVYTVNALFRVGPIVAQVYLSLLIIANQTDPCVALARSLVSKCATYTYEALNPHTEAVTPSSASIVAGMEHCHNPQCPTLGSSTAPTRLLLCSRCKKVKYCSAECQRAHYKTHKTACVSSG